MPREFDNLDLYLRQNASGLANSILHCPACGRDHPIPIERIQIGDGLIHALPDLAAEMLGHKPHKGEILDRAGLA